MRLISHINRFCQQRSLKETKKIILTLTSCEKRLLVFFIKHFSNNLAINPYQAWIANKLGCSVITVKRSVKNLCDLGLMSKYRFFKGPSHYFMDPYFRNRSSLKKMKDILPEIMDLFLSAIDTLSTSSSISTIKRVVKRFIKWYKMPFQGKWGEYVELRN